MMKKDEINQIAYDVADLVQAQELYNDQHAGE